MEECVERFTEELREVDALEAVTRFANKLLRLHNQIEGNQDLQDPEKLLASPDWVSFQIAARRVIELPGVKPYRTGRTDIIVTAG